MRATSQLGLFDTAAATSVSLPAPSQSRNFCFYLGTHKYHWLWNEDFRGVPLFISYRQLREANRAKKAYRRSVSPWCLDSGGFIELTEHGRWTIPAKEYAAAVQRYHHEVGGLQWAAVQDWMVEPIVREQTGKTVLEHQYRTMMSYFQLRDLAPEVPWAPVLQGWSPGDYLDHAEQYEQQGVDLRKFPVVPIGSMCRRSATMRAATLMGELVDMGINIHPLGFKRTGLVAPSYAGPPYQSAQPPGSLWCLWERSASSDSTAWSMDARNPNGLSGGKPLAGCTHEKCNNCPSYALAWYQRLVSGLATAAAEYQHSDAEKRTGRRLWAPRLGLT